MLIYFHSLWNIEPSSFCSKAVECYKGLFYARKSVKDTECLPRNIRILYPRDFKFDGRRFCGLEQDIYYLEAITIRQ